MLDRLAREARHGVLVVSDSDITVGAGYLRQVAAAPLADPAIGMVTCLYRATVAAGSGARASRSHRCVRRLHARAVWWRELLASQNSRWARPWFFARRFRSDRRIRRHRRLRRTITSWASHFECGKVTLASAVVETRMSGQGWGEVWRHQLRWSRTIRVSRSGYYGYAITNATVWSRCWRWQAGRGPRRFLRWRCAWRRV